MPQRSPTLVLLLSSLMVLNLLLGCAGSSYSKGEAAMAPAPPPAGAPPGDMMAEEDAADLDEGSDAGSLTMRSQAARATLLPPRTSMFGALAEDGQGTEAQEQQGQGEQKAEGQKAEQRAPLLIYQATLTMSVFETKQRIDEVEAIAKKKGGYLLTRTDQMITIRVPAETFTETLEEVAKTGDELHREVSARDVTEQYNDLAIRLRNAEAMRERLVALLAKATTVKDALAVEEQLERVALDIEQIKGKLKRLGELIAFSTITVRYEARPVDKVDSKVNLPFPWLQDLGLVRLLDL